MQDSTITILFVVVGVKMCLFLYSKALARHSCTAEALAGRWLSDAYVAFRARHSIHRCSCQAPARCTSCPRVTLKSRPPGRLTRVLTGCAPRGCGSVCAVTVQRTTGTTC
jgi:hypothetical protein